MSRQFRLHFRGSRVGYCVALYHPLVYLCVCVFRFASSHHEVNKLGRGNVPTVPCEDTACLVDAYHSRVIARRQNDRRDVCCGETSLQYLLRNHQHSTSVMHSTRSNTPHLQADTFKWYIFLALACTHLRERSCTQDGIVERRAWC